MNREANKIIKKEKTVQFNLTNTTSNPLEVDLFDLSITNTPTQDTGQISPPTAWSVFGISAVNYFAWEDNTNTGGGFRVQRSLFGGVNQVQQIDNTGAPIGVTTLPAPPAFQPNGGVAFSPVTNTLFIGNSAGNNVTVVDTLTNTVITTILNVGLANITSLTFVPTVNEIWAGTTDPADPVQRIDVFTNTVLAPIVTPVVSRVGDIEYHPATDLVYFTAPDTQDIVYHQPNGAFRGVTAIPLPEPTSLNIVNGFAWIGNVDALGTSNQVVIVNLTTFATSSITVPNNGNIGRYNFTYYPLYDRVYAWSSAGETYAFSESTKTLQEVFTGNTPITGFIVGWSFIINQTSSILGYGGAQLAISNAGTVTSTPFYIGGAVDYNFFVQNLEYEPMKINCIGIYSQTQEQLYNPLEIKTKDSTGKEYQSPDFPILQVSQWQEQGNRSKIQTDGLIFDGRTFFSQYRINAGETVTFEICYEQLNRFCFGEYPNLFPEKQPIAPVITEDIKTVICEREQSYKDVDKTHKCKEGKSIFSVTLTNTTGGTQFVNLFDNYNLGVFNPNVTIQDRQAYDFFTESVGEEPVKVSCLDVITDNQNQLNNNIVIQTKEATGYINSKPVPPIVNVDTNQDQSNRSFIEFDKLIFDGNTTFASYPIDANETVTLVFYYHQFKRASILSDDNATRVKIKPAEPIIDYGKLDKIANKAKYECERTCKKIEISVANTTGSDNTFNFFQANQSQLVVNQPNAQFDNVDDYNFLIQQLRDSPLVICGIEVIGADQDQLGQPVIVNTKDSNGDRFNYQHFPVNYVSTNQRNGERVFVKTNHLILDGYTTFPLYNILANGRVTFVLYYRQYLRSDFMKIHVFPVLKRPIANNGSEVGEEIEYYNELTTNADNSWGIDGSGKKHTEKNANKTEKSVIFDAEQVYSRDSNRNRTDSVLPFIKQAMVKYALKKGGCDIPKSPKQKIYVNPNDLSFGGDSDVVPVSEQGYNQFESEPIKPTGLRNFTDPVASEEEYMDGERGWTYKDALHHWETEGGKQSFFYKVPLKPSNRFRR
jgi:hypothetical protein